METRERTVPIHRIEYDVNWPPGHVAGYLIACEQPVLVDAGMPGSSSNERLDESLATHGYEIDEIEHLVLTHPHIDHIGQVPELIDSADPTVYAPRSIRARFDRELDSLETTVRQNARAAGFSGAELDFLISKAVESLRRNRELLPTGAVDAWVEGGDTIEIGGKAVEVLHTPGHQADHCCFRFTINGERVLVSGDMAISSFRPVILHAGLDDGVQQAVEKFYTALDRLTPLDIDRVYPGHGPVHSDFEGIIERDRTSLDRMLDNTVDTLNNGDEMMTAADVATERTGNRDTTYIASEVVAALSHLETDGRIHATETDGVRQYYA